MSRINLRKIKRKFYFLKILFKFEIIKYQYKSRKVLDYINFENNPSNYYILNLQPDKPNLNGVDTVYELSIPTCSYRMGVPHMGFGVLTLSIFKYFKNPNKFS